MSKKYHGSSHLKGGFDIDENSMPDNSNYWKGCSKFVYEKINIENTEREIYHSKELTWKEKYFQLEKILEKEKNRC